VSAWPGTSILPKARVLSPRTMEIFCDIGVADEIYAKGAHVLHHVPSTF